MNAALDTTRDLKKQLITCPLDLKAVNLENKKLIEEVNLKTKLIKQLVDDLQHLKHEKRSLQQKVSGLVKAVLFIHIFLKALYQRQSRDQNC